MNRTKVLGLAATAMLASLTFGQLPATAAPQQDDFGVLMACSTANQNLKPTRAEVIARAQSWVDEGVAYNQGGCYSNRFGNYRMDCSGHASMAWGLDQSRVTWTLPEVSTEIAFDALKPGDVLNDIQNHVSMFAGWANAEHTQLIMLNHGGPGRAERTVWTRAYASQYKAYRYNNIVDSEVSQPTPVVLPNNALALYRVAADGNVYGTSQSAPGAAFGAWQRITTGGGFAGKPAAIVFPNQTIGLYVRTADGRVLGAGQSVPGAAFGPWAMIGGSGGVASDPTVLLTQDNTVAVYVTNTAGGTSGAAQSAPGTTIGSWQRIGGANQVGKPAAVQFRDGQIGLYVRTGDGRIEAAGQTAKGGGFSPFATIGGSGGVAGDPTAVLLGNAVAVYVTNASGGVSGAAQSGPGTNIGTWQMLGGAKLTGRLDAVVFGNDTDGYKVGLYARTSDGRVEAAGQTAPGSGFSHWASIGGSGGVASDADAVLTPAGTVAVYVTNSEGGVSGAAQPAPGTNIGTWQRIG